jgi:hypothetical protein
MGNEGAKLRLEQLTKVAKAQSGSILLLENSRSSNPLLARYQDVTAETAAMAEGKGCVYNQDVEALIKATRGLTIQQEESYVAGLFRPFKCGKPPHDSNTRPVATNMKHMYTHRTGVDARSPSRLGTTSTQRRTEMYSSYPFMPDLETNNAGFVYENPSK